MNKYKKILLFIILILPFLSQAALNPLSQPDLKLGDTHVFIKQLQTLFNNNGLIINKTSGQSGSRGFETTYFGEKTKQALINFQNKYKIAPATGALGVKTKTKINDLLTTKQWSEVSTGKTVGLTSQSCTSASKDGITWTWTPARPCGTYVTGDNWVVGPITVTSITPAPVKYAAQPDGTIIVDNGSMLNPNISTDHGFTSRGTYNIKKTNSESFYKDSLNVGLQLPLNIAVNNSLVSSITGTSDTTWSYPIKTYAILTVTDSAPADGSFRPSPLGSGSKASLWNESQIDYSKLRSYSRAGMSVPDINAYASDFNKPWLELDPNWTGGYIRAPYMAYHGYGQYIAQKTADAGIMLNLNYSNAEKRNLLIGVIQAGIDNYGFIQRGGAWYNDGGHNLGRLNPVMIAATVLNDNNIKSIIKGSSLKFQEFQNTFYVTQEDVNRRTQRTYTGVNGDVNIPYTSSDIGLAEWGVRHTGAMIYLDNKWTAASYRAINGSTFLGTTILARILNLQDYIDHPALFDYAIRHLGMENQNVCLESAGVDETAGCVAYNRIPAFHRQMYTLYNGGVVDVVPVDTGNTGNTGGTTTSAPSKPTITAPSTSANTTIPSTTSITFTWTSTSTIFLTRFATTSSDYGTLIGNASMDDSYTSKSRTYSVTPGNYYKFWVHAGNISSPSPQAEINIYVSPSVNVNTYTLAVSKTGTGVGYVNGVDQATTTLNQGDSITLIPEAEINSTFTGWSGDCSGTGSCVINNIQSNKTVSANFNSTLTPQFVNGDRIQITRNVNVRSSPSLGGSTNLLGVQASSSLGVVKSSHTIADGVVWYNIDYDNGVDGYSGQDYFIKYINVGTTTQSDMDADDDSVDDINDKCPNTPAGVVINNHGCPLPTTTNLKLISNATTSDITNISNLEISDRNNSYGKIKFNQAINIFGNGSKNSPINLDSYIEIKNKQVVVKSDLAPQFNKSATITLYGVTYNKPIIKKDGEIYATSSSPHIVSYDKVSGTLVFTVNGFSTYDIIDDATTYTLNATKTGNGTGFINGISSSTTSYTEGTQVSLTAEADNGSSFSGWSGDCMGNGVCSIVITGNKTIAANFNLNQVTTPSGGGGSGGGGGGGGGGGSVITTTNTNTSTGGSGGGGGGGGSNTNFVTTNSTSNTQTITTVSVVFNTDLKVGMRHPDVKKLQQFLNSKGYTIAATGSGSKGNESDYFGPATQKALIKYQQANLITPATGYFGKLTRAKLGTVNISTTNTLVTTPVVTTNTTPLNYTFTINLKLGMRHPDVKKLQQFLNNNGYTISTSGLGSKGNESDYFGVATQKALIRYQIDKKITPAAGYFGALTRSMIK